MKPATENRALLQQVPFICLFTNQMFTASSRAWQGSNANQKNLLWSLQPERGGRSMRIIWCCCTMWMSSGDLVHPSIKNHHHVGHILRADLWCQSRRTHRGWCRWREGVCPCSSDQYFGWIHYSCWLPFLDFHNKLPVISQKPAYTRSVRQSRHSPLQRALQNFPRRDIGLLSNPTKNFIAIAGPASLLCHRTASSCQVTTS